MKKLSYGIYGTESKSVLKQLYDLLTAAGLTSEEVLAVIARMADLLARITHVLNDEQYRSNIGSSDIVRDDRLRAVHASLLCASYSLDAPTKAAGTDLMHIFEVHGGKSIITMPINAETGSIGALISDLRDEDNVTKVALCPFLDAYLTQLEEANEATSAESLKYAEEKAAEKLEEKVTGLKQEIIVLINQDVVPLFDIKARYDSNFRQLNESIQKIIIEQNTTVKMRQNEREDSNEREVEEN